MKLEVRNLTAGYGGKIVLDGVELEVAPGKIVTLLGPNGCGKSTLLKTIGRLLAPKQGAVYLDGKAVHALNTAELARELAILPQIHRAPADLTVAQLVEFGRFPHRGAFSSTSKHDREVIDRVLAMTRLGELRNRNLETLSGGERQRAWIAMTLAQEPKLLLLDEPTTFLDVCCQLEVIELVRKLNRELGLTVVMVLHDLNLAARASDVLAAVKDGKIYRSGSVEEVLDAGLLRDVFDVEAEIVTGSDGVVFCIPTGSRRNGKGM